MKTTTIIVFAALALGCSDPDDTFRDGDRFTFLDESLDLIGVGTEPPEDHQVCCENGGCSPAVNGACPQGGVLHNCSDEEICNDDGSACWYECAPAQPPPMSSEDPLGVSVPCTGQNFDGCYPGGCCTYDPFTNTYDCWPASDDDCGEQSYLSCDAGTCFSGNVGSGCFNVVTIQSCCSR